MWNITNLTDSHVDSVQLPTNYGLWNSTVDCTLQAKGVYSPKALSGWRFSQVGIYLFIYFGGECVRLANGSYSDISAAKHGCLWNYTLSSIPEININL